MISSLLARTFDFFDTPWLSREMRSRWRRPASYGALFAVNVALILVFYQSLPRFVDIERAEYLGQRITSNHFWTVFWVWAILLPILVAPLLCEERSKGMLEGLLLTRLTPLQVVLGLAMREVLFALALYCSTLPALALALNLGGLDPVQMLGMSVLQLGLAIFIVCCSLANSITSPSSGAAILSTYVWLAVSAVVTAFHSSVGQELARLLTDPNNPHGTDWATALLSGAFISNPAMAFAISNGNAGLFYIACPFGCGATLSLAGLLLLRRRARSLLKPNEAVASHPAWHQDYGKNATSEPSPAATLWEVPLPLAQWFVNPFIKMEVTRTLRFEAPSFWLVMLTLPCIVFFYVVIYLPQHFVNSEVEPMRSPILSVLMTAGPVFTLLLLIQSTTSWSAERRSGNAVHLRLVGISPASAVLFKMAGIVAGVAPCLLVLAPSWLWLLVQLALGSVDVKILGALASMFSTAPLAVCAGSALGISSERPGPATLIGLGILFSFWWGVLRFVDYMPMGEAPMRFSIVAMALSGATVLFAVWAVRQFERLTGDE